MLSVLADLVCGAPGVRRGADAVRGEILRAADPGVDALSPVLVSDLGQSVVPLEVTERTVFQEGHVPSTSAVLGWEEAKVFPYSGSKESRLLRDDDGRAGHLTHTHTDSQ